MNSYINDFLKDPLKIQTASDNTAKIWDTIKNVSGFPEPFLKNNTTGYNRWSGTFSAQLIREDIRDLSDIRNISDLETLYYLLPEKAGNPLSIQSLANDLKVSYNTISSWLNLFENFFLIFTITPWTKKINRSIHKEKKIYIWDIPKISNPGAKFENMVALELYRAVSNWTDLGCGRFSLHYIKDKEKNEVDFLIAKNNSPVLIIETKLKDKTVSGNLYKFQDILNVPAIQLINSGNFFQVFTNKENDILVAPAHIWIPMLP